MPINPFIKDKSVRVDFVLALSKETGEVVADYTEEELKAIYEIEPETLEKHHAVFRIPDFVTQARMTDQALRVASDGIRLEANTYELVRLKTLLQEWSFSDKVAASEVDSLDPHVAAILIGAMREHID